MIVLIVVLCLVVVSVVVAILVWWWRRAPAPVSVAPATEQVDETAERRARQRALEPVETELLDRRMQLDSRRGTLGGDMDVLEAIERLEQQFRDGQIGEEEFEAEKVRLLSGG